MAKEMPRKHLLTVPIFKILILVIAIPYCLGFVGNLYYGLNSLSLLGRQGFTYLPMTALRLYICLTSLLYLIALYQLFRLLLKASGGGPFDPEISRRSRKVAYVAFGISALTLLYKIVVNFNPKFSSALRTVDAGTPFFYAVLILILDAAPTALVGTGILIIAKVLELGVKLQKDQNLTV